MISRLSSIIAEALYKSQVIAEEDKELYTYGFFVLLSKTLFFLISTLFGWVFGVLWESMVFYIMFSTLRSYAGGFHASKESVCTCCTTVALFLSSLSIWYMERIESSTIPFCILVLSSTVVYLLSPLDSEDKPLNFDEINHYRRTTRVIILLLWISVIIGLYLQLRGVVYAASTCMILESSLLILGRINRYNGKPNNQ